MMAQIKLANRKDLAAYIYYWINFAASVSDLSMTGRDGQVAYARSEVYKWRGYSWRSAPPSSPLLGPSPNLVSADMPAQKAEAIAYCDNLC